MGREGGLNLLSKFGFVTLTLCYLQDPKVYVQTILDVHKKYNALVITAFVNDAGFVAALDKVGLLGLLSTCSH